VNRLLVAVLVIVAACLAACGGGDEATPTPTIPPGVNGSLPRHLTAVTPQQGSTVTNGDMHIGESPATGGVCASFDFTAGDGMGDDPTSRVTMTVNQEDVTASASWVITPSQPPTSGTMCYAAPQPFPEGTSIVTLLYSDSTDRQFFYSWDFTVAPAGGSPSATG
jgi:hypothetical protein